MRNCAGTRVYNNRKATCPERQGEGDGKVEDVMLEAKLTEQM